VTPPTLAKKNAFSALMGANQEAQEWKVAEKSDNTKGRMPVGEKRAVPFYKWVDGMCVTVDAFKYGNIPGCNGYFLRQA
jgi:DNA cross-link repair 1A protein